MKVIKQKQLINTDRDVNFKEGKSLRYLIASDNMGFSLHKTIIPKGQKGFWHYKHHLESCFCVSGKGVLTNLETGNTFRINPNDCYVLDKNDNHCFEALEDVFLISVFNPPVEGNEIHEEDGSYSEGNYLDSQVTRIVEAVNCSKNNYEAKELVKEILTFKI